MNFSSPTFIFYFFPVFLVLYWFSPSKFRLFILTTGSTFFYLWGDTAYFPVLLVLLILNYRFISQLQKMDLEEPRAKRLIVMAILVNICLLPAMKIFAAFYYDILQQQNPTSTVLSQGLNTNDYLPVGLSFITIQSLSLILDVQKKKRNPNGSTNLNPSHYFSYLMMFPKVIAGPIARYADISSQLKVINVNLDTVTIGMERFITGLAKKTIIADQLAPMVNSIFTLDATELTTHYAWLGLVGFSLQLYFDFSGYTDMAIGIGQMLGIKLPENFDSPYLATSIINFWRRWHITLSNWFRDYLFYPLERARQGKSESYRFINVLIVFLATGLWHGITLNYVIWGLLHGVAIAFEISPLGSWLKKSWVGFQRLYALGIILLGWVFFRADGTGDAIIFIRALFGLNPSSIITPFEKQPVMGGLTWISLIAGIILCLPIRQWLANQTKWASATQSFPFTISQVGLKFVLIALLTASIIMITASSFQAVLYSRF